MKPTTKPTRAEHEAYNEAPTPPESVVVNSRKALHELDSYLQGIKQADRTRQAFYNFY